MPNLEDVLRGLTSGSVETLKTARYLDPRLYGRSGFEVTGRSVPGLVRKGLAEDREIRGFTGRSRRGKTLTASGLEVRARLLSSSGATDHAN